MTKFSQTITRNLSAMRDELLVLREEREKFKLNVEVLKELEDRLQGLVIHKDLPTVFVEYIKQSVLTPQFVEMMKEVREVES